MAAKHTKHLKILHKSVIKVVKCGKNNDNCAKNNQNSGIYVQNGPILPIFANCPINWTKTCIKLHKYPHLRPFWPIYPHICRNCCILRPKSPHYPPYMQKHVKNVQKTCIFSHFSPILPLFCYILPNICPFLWNILLIL